MASIRYRVAHQPCVTTRTGICSDSAVGVKIKLLTASNLAKFPLLGWPSFEEGAFASLHTRLPRSSMGDDQIHATCPIADDTACKEGHDITRKAHLFSPSSESFKTKFETVSSKTLLTRMQRYALMRPIYSTVASSYPNLIPEQTLPIVIAQSDTTSTTPTTRSKRSFAPRSTATKTATDTFLIKEGETTTQTFTYTERTYPTMAKAKRGCFSANASLHTFTVTRDDDLGTLTTKTVTLVLESSQILSVEEVGSGEDL
ncbi:hypothetical protein EV356DRAFT_566109 [Viridothelium virens]|uniref:Uncharacterized protein n=1 Tax=Viridothelium virens TaxID=1048519 RepID=A0A6A6HE68_VIRVR|nr:hypothetical protein EV356DRAFT_566109 [Viridothelium virens]